MEALVIIFIIFFIGGLFIASLRDEAEIKEGKQKKQYSPWKAGTRIRKSGEHESNFMTIVVIIIIISTLIGLIIAG